ncbi:hypothetical protein ACFQYP_50650 [Nonomuraea antimicrobica]
MHMATVYQYLPPEEAALRTAAGFPQFVINQGTTFPVTGLAFDGAGTAQEYAYWKFTPFGYAAGADVTVEIIWYAVSGTSGTVNWGRPSLPSRQARTPKTWRQPASRACQR